MQFVGCMAPLKNFQVIIITRSVNGLQSCFCQYSINENSDLLAITEMDSLEKL